MPIYLIDSSGPNGVVSATLDTISSSLSGSNSPQPDINGSISRALEPLNISFRDGELYPLLGTVRIGNRNYSQSGSLAALDRQAMGLFDAVLLGGFFGSDQDSGSPGPNWISRTQVTQEILDSYPGVDPYVFTYLNQMESSQSGSFATKIGSETGPNGTDWWFRDSTGSIVTTGFGSLINITDQVTPDSEGRRFPQWYVDTRVQTELIDPHIVAGIGYGKGGMNGWWDNLGVKVRKSAVDPDQDAANNDMQQYFDADDATHMSGNDQYGQPRSEAVGYVSEYRANQIDALKRIQNANPGFLCGGNTNQWDDVDGTYIIREYRVSFGDINSPSWTQTGLSENNTWGPSGFPRTGTWNDGTYIGAGNTWKSAYDNIYLVSASPGLSAPNIVFGEFDVSCNDSATTGPGGNPIYDSIPSSNASYDVFRWGFCTALIAGAYASISGTVVGTQQSGRRHMSVLFDEYGLINGNINYGFGRGADNGDGTFGTRLFRKWMGQPLEPPPTAANADGSWSREFTNALLILNPENNKANSHIVIDVSALPGGATEWTRFVGFQDTSVNTGNDADSDFNMPPVNAIVLVRKSWYDAL